MATSDAPTSVFNPSPSRVQWVLLALIVVLSTILRFIYIGAHPPHFDEFWNLEMTTGRGSIHETLPMNVLIESAPGTTSLSGAPPWYAIPGSLERVTHPPAYHMLLRLFRGVFGESIAAGRAFSALFSVLCVLAVFDAARLSLGVTPALWTSLLMAVSSFQIDLAQEIRSYPVAMFGVLLAAGAMLRVERFGPTPARIVAMGLSLLVAALTHYFVAPVAGAMGLYALIRLPGRARLSIVLTIVACWAIFLMIWTPMLLKQRQAVSETLVAGSLLETAPNPALVALRRAAAAPLRLLFEPRKGLAPAAMLSGAIYVLPWLMLRRTPSLLLWSMWLVAVVGFCLALDVAQTTRHLAQIRHCAMASPALCAILAGLTMSFRSAFLRNALPGTIALACAAALGVTYTRDNPRYAELAAPLDDPAHARAPIVYYSESTHPWAGWLLYLGTSHYSRTFPRPIARLDRPASDELIDQLRRWDEFWVTWTFTSLRPEQIIPGTQVVFDVGEPYIGRVARVRWAAPSTQP